MVNFRSLFSVAISIAAIAQDVAAHSTQRNPLKYISLLEEPTLRTSSKRVHHHSSFDLTFALHDKKQEIRLALEPNDDILHENMHINYIAADGTITEAVPLKRHEHKVYRGKAFVRREGSSNWYNAGWARVTVHRDGKYPIFEGAFRIDGDSHHIQTGKNYNSLRHTEDPTLNIKEDPAEYMVVWRDSDVMEYYRDPHDLKRDVRGQSNCLSDKLKYNANYDPFVADTSLSSVDPGFLFGRQIDPGQTGDAGGAGYNLASTIGNPNGCPTTRKIALVGIATDCSYTDSFNSTQSTRENVIQQVNAASEVYESSFNISLGIQNLTITEGPCPSTPNDAAPWNQACDASGVDISTRLNLFSAWRGQSTDSNAFWTLLSTCNTQSAVGLAWLGQVCVPGSQDTRADDGTAETVAAANVVIRTQSEWQVFAHEAGHTFGAVHDCDENACSGNARQMQRCCPLTADSCDARGRFIMNPSTGTDITNFSPCTVGNICSAILRNAVRSECLANNRDVSTITRSQCGNGIVESGEDCDCGGPEGCGNNSCCDAETCRFTDNSVCDPSNEDCCNDSCQFASSGTVCRASTGECDPQETCPGDSSICPSDKSLDDGESCGNDGDGLRCASGQCTSRDLQCQSAVGARDTRNETTGCSDGCMISCRSPTAFQTDECRLMAQNFLDGTPCQNGGKCNNGMCQGSSWTNVLKDNLHIVIPVASVVGGLIVLAILWCCISSWCKRRKAKKTAKQPPSPPPMQSWNSYGGRQGGGGAAAVPVPPTGWNQQRSNSNNSHSQPYNYYQQQQQAYAAYQQPSHQPQYPGQWHPQRSTSARYA